MARTVSREFSFSVAALVLLGAASGCLSLASTIRLERLFRDVANERFSTSKGALGLENTLLEQRGLLTRALLPGEARDAILELRWRHANWSPALDEVRRTATHPDEQRLLQRADSAYRSLVSAEELAIKAIEARELKAAREIILNDVTPLSRETHGLCEQVVLAQTEHVRLALADARQQVMSATVAVLAGLAITVIAGTMLILLLLRRVIWPLRRLTSEASQGIPARASAGPSDEIATLGHLLDSLSQNAEISRASLVRSEGRRDQAEARGKLAACVAHEVRTPLQTMSIALRSIRREAGDNPVLLERCEMFREELDRLEGIVREFLEFARPPGLNLAPIELDRVIERSLALFKDRLAEKGVRIEQPGTPVPMPVHADPAQLQQVVHNLISNSLCAMPRGGVIRISREVEPDSGGRMAVVRLSDEGGGISSEMQARLFQPFATSRPDGTGLGLAISATIVKRHGGTLKLESTGSEGTTFAFRLPLLAD